MPKFNRVCVLLRASGAALLLAVCFWGQGPRAAEVSWETLIERVARQSKPYNNISEIQTKMPPGFFDRIDASELVAWIEKGFRQHPSDKDGARDLLFAGLDVAAVASQHDGYAPLVRHRLETTRRVYQELQKAPATRLVLYKLYNEGTIIRTPGVCVGIDVTLHPQNNDLAPGFAKVLDALLVSHDHADHLDRQSRLIPELQKAGKPVILPDNYREESLPLGSTLKTGKIGVLEWTAFRGRQIQEKNPSAWFYIQVGGWNIVHSGDNTAWLEYPKNYLARVDIFLLKPESIYVIDGKRQGEFQAAMEESMRKIRPRIVVPHHLLELGHGLGAYGHDMGMRLRGQVPAGTEVRMLHWGESLSFPLIMPRASAASMIRPRRVA